MTSFHRPKDVAAFVAYLPTTTFECKRVARTFAGHLDASDRAGDVRASALILQSIAHVRYRFIILSNCTDYESLQFKLLFEASLPDYKCRNLFGRVELLSTPISSDNIPCQCGVCVSVLKPINHPIVSYLEEESVSFHDLVPVLHSWQTFQHAEVSSDENREPPVIPVILTPRVSTSVGELIGDNKTNCVVLPSSRLGKVLERKEKVISACVSVADNYLDSEHESKFAQCASDYSTMTQAISELKAGKFYYRHGFSRLDYEARLSYTDPDRDLPDHGFSDGVARACGLMKEFALGASPVGYVMPAYTFRDCLPLEMCVAHFQSRAFLASIARVRKKLKE